MTMLKLKLLGGFEVRNGKGPAVRVSAKKNRVLLAALALAPSCSMPRERIASLLWSDRGDAQARNSLRQALIHLRADLARFDVPLLSIADDRVGLDPENVAVDAVEFERLAGSDDVTTLRRAAALYQGDLLADVGIKDPAYEEWVGTERRRLHDLAVNVVERLYSLQAGKARVEAAQSLVALDPLREASHRILMEAYAEAGEKSLALRQYQVLCQILKQELGAHPEAETETLRRRLLNGSTPDGPPPAAERNNRNGVDSGLPAAVRPAREAKPTLAVLPFDVLSRDPDLNEFSDGLTEDIISALSRIRSISIVSRNLAFTYKGRAVDIREVGRELGARYILEGGVRKAGTRIRISAQLSQTTNGHHIWAGRIDRAIGDTFDLQDEITSSIVASLQTQLILSEGRAVEGEDESVARLLAQSWQQFLGLTAQSLSDCRSLANRALRLDDTNGMAHRMLAVALYHQAYMGFIPWTRQVIEDSYQHAKISVEAEDVDEYCHWAMACAQLLRKEHDRAVASLRRALEINPNCSLAHGAMGTVLAWSGRSDEAIRSNEFALRINPDDPSIFFRHLGLGLAHYLAARHDQALHHAIAALEMRPDWWLGVMIYCASLAELGRADDARRTLEEAMRVRATSLPSFDILPFANPLDRERLLGGLRKAGLPD